jgi:hypothetical protein
MARCFHLPKSRLPVHMVAAAITTATLLAFAVNDVSAQTTYTCFPTCDSTDGRFMALSGTDYNAFAGDEIVLGLGTPGNYATLEIGIFDGESGGMWDFSAAPLEFTLFADSSGDGKGSIQVGQWIGTSMPDNAWYTVKVANVDAAKAHNGNYVYYMRIRSTDTTIKSTSSFKVRTNGTITIKSHQAFAIYAPLTKEADAKVIYPLYPDLSKMTYDGTWRLFVDVPEQSSNMTIWDGDMDYGSFDGSAMDTDDGDTPNTLPEWATRSAVPEGNATSVWTIRDPNRPNTDIKMSGDPADNNQNLFYRRSNPITYEVIDPTGRSFANDNPSGNLEWEQFRLDTEPFDRTKMDYHVDSVPVGIYQVHVSGMDMGNVNSWRFFNSVAGVTNLEVIGVDANGNPVVPIRAVETVSGGATGIVYYDSDTNGVQGAGEPGIPTVTVKLTSYYPDGSVKATTSAVTDIDGRFYFSSLGAGSYTVAVDMSTLENDVAETTDPDGTSTPYSATVTVSASAPNAVVPFGYRRLSSVGTLTRGYWVNHPENWPVNAISLGGVIYTKDEAMLILKQPTKGDRTYSMAAQLIATKLNLANGTLATCIGDYVVAADEWLHNYPVGSARLFPCDWTTGNPIHNMLDDYNNGRLCVGHMN